MGGEALDAWLLTDRGILDLDGKPVPGIPFGERSATAGVAGSEIGVIVDEQEVWIRSGTRWKKAVSSGGDLYSIERAGDGRFLVGTERARVAWVEDGRLAYIEAFDAVPGRRLWDTPYGAPADPATVFAPPADGFHISHDHGDSFQRRRGGMPYVYQRAVACFRGRDVYLASTARHDGGTGAVP